MATLIVFNINQNPIRSHEIRAPKNTGIVEVDSVNWTH